MTLPLIPCILRRNFERTGRTQSISQKQHHHEPPEPVIGLIHPGKIAQIVRCEAKNQQNPGKRLNAKRAFSHEDAFFFYPGFSLYAGTMGTSWKPSFAAFFDNIPHELILNRIAVRVADGNILRLIREFLSAGVMEGLEFRPTTSGTPQGGVISPLLANIVLDLLDQRLTQSGFRFVRYADDFVVLCRSHALAKQALAFVDTTLRSELGLSLSPTKTKVVSFVEGFDFLGFHVSKRRISIREKSIEKLKARVRLLTTRSHNLCDQVFRELNRVLIGYAHYFAAPFASVADQFRLLDHWIRASLSWTDSPGNSLHEIQGHLARV
jgi:hypothetical protein